MADDAEQHQAVWQKYLPSYSLQSQFLNNLANRLRNRFSRRGILSALDDVEHLGDRFLQRDISSDLDKCIELHRDALLLHPSDRFLQQGIPSDLDECIKLFRDALLLRPSGHSDRSQSLNNLAISLQDRFLQWGVLSDLDESIRLH
ncbi:hypothetical protein BD769DRAFT_1667504 [Suillus cothurnatus]|nr:hypothetical protein BD769DRAFT_1667504 [Suillus cothurnatus]